MKKENEDKSENSENLEVLKDYGQVGRIVKIDLSSNGTDVFGGFQWWGDSNGYEQRD